MDTEAQPPPSSETRPADQPLVASKVPARRSTGHGLTELSLYPEDRGCVAPTAARVLEIFTGLTRHHLHDTDGHLVQTFHPELTDLQHQVLDLLGIPTSVYTPDH